MGKTEGNNRKTGPTGLLRTPYADWWYLREGDFRPERVADIFNGNGCCGRFMEEMKDLGNLFPTREEAAKASDEIRAYLRSKHGKHP